MKKYSDGDIATFYFVIVSDDNNSRIQGYTDNKDLVNSYMEFHKSKNFKVKKITDSINNIYKILDENIHDEINIANITIRSPKNQNKSKFIQIPATEVEMMFVNEETNQFLVSRIDYSFLNEFIPFLKPKYQKLMKDILLTDFIDRIVHNVNRPSILDNVEYDQLLILFDSFPDNFGD